MADNLGIESRARTFTNNEFDNKDSSFYVQNDENLISSRPNPFENIRSGSNSITVHPGDIDETYHYPGLSAVSLFTNLLSHPFIVLRRQCQVNRTANHYHIAPLRIFQVTLRLRINQGYGTFWKGISSVFLLNSLTAASETILCELTSFPREIKASKGFITCIKHYFLKGLGTASVTSFISASLIETVQSDIASEKIGILEFMKEGICRLLKWRTSHSSRLLPIWILVIPTMSHRVLHFMILYSVHRITRFFIHRSNRHLLTPKDEDNEENKNISSPLQNFFVEIVATTMGQLMSDALLYPIETIVNRLHLQGTRTIIDNLDSGASVIPIISKYEGFKDCFNTILEEEGVAGFYKGFGLLILQYALQIFILKGLRLFLSEISSMRKSTKNDK